MELSRFIRWTCRSSSTCFSRSCPGKRSTPRTGSNSRCASTRPPGAPSDTRKRSKRCSTRPSPCRRLRPARCGQIRARLERMEYAPQREERIVHRPVEPDLHPEGRPFFITEGLADRVAIIADEYWVEHATHRPRTHSALEQLLRLNKDLGSTIDIDGQSAPPTLAIRRNLLNELKRVHDLAHAADGDLWEALDRKRKSADQALAEDLPWQAVWLASRAVPFWVGRDVDGLETICKAAGVEPPACFSLHTGCSARPASDSRPATGPAYRVAGRPRHRRFRAGRRCVGIARVSQPRGLAHHPQRPRSRRGRGARSCCARSGECAHHAESHEMAISAVGVPPLYERDE